MQKWSFLQLLAPLGVVTAHDNVGAHSPVKGGYKVDLNPKYFTV